MNGLLVFMINYFNQNFKNNNRILLSICVKSVRQSWFGCRLYFFFISLLVLFTRFALSLRCENYISILPGLGSSTKSSVPKKNERAKNLIYCRYAIVP